MFRSRSGKTVAPSLLIGALALLIPAIAGCEAGLNAPTLEFHDAASGAYAAVNGITISNAFVLGAPAGSALPPGSSASVFLSLFNTGNSNDALTGLAATGSASSAHVSGGTISLPADSPVNLTGPHPSLVLTGLTKPLGSGGDIPVTLTFAHAGSVTFTVPVQPQSYDYATYSPPPSPAPTPTPTPTTPTPTPTPTPTATKTPPATKSPAAKKTTPAAKPSATSTK